jgi:hypothetical protein
VVADSLKNQSDTKEIGFLCEQCDLIERSKSPTIHEPARWQPAGEVCYDAGLGLYAERGGASSD